MGGDVRRDQGQHALTLSPRSRDLDSRGSRGDLAGWACIDVDQCYRQHARLEFRCIAMILRAVELATSMGSGPGVLLTGCHWNPIRPKCGRLLGASSTGGRAARRVDLATRPWG